MESAVNRAALEEQIREREEKLRLLEREEDSMRSVIGRLEHGIETDRAAIIRRRAALENPVLNTSRALQSFRTSLQQMLDEQPGGDQNTLFVHAVEAMRDRVRENNSRMELLREEIRELQQQMEWTGSIHGELQPGFAGTKSEAITDSVLYSEGERQQTSPFGDGGVQIRPSSGGSTGLFRNLLERDLEGTGGDSDDPFHWNNGGFSR